MTRIRLARIATATTTFACTALLSFTWSEQRGASLSVESAQARVGRPLTPASVAGVARRQTRRAAYGYGYGAGVVGGGVAAAAIGTATAAAATSPWASGYPGGYYGANASGYPGYYGGDYATRSYVTRPTLFPRYLAGNYGAYCYGGYPYGYYWSCPWGGYYGGGW
jgi:hypothetical protein